LLRSTISTIQLETLHDQIAAESTVPSSSSWAWQQHQLISAQQSQKSMDLAYDDVEAPTSSSSTAFSVNELSLGTENSEGKEHLEQLNHELFAELTQITAELEDMKDELHRATEERDSQTAKLMLEIELRLAAEEATKVVRVNLILTFDISECYMCCSWLPIMKYSKKK
jgi:hypothetical protein